MFVPLLVLDGLLGAALVVLMIRQARLRVQATALPDRLRAAEDRVEQSIAALHRATDSAEPADEPGPAEVRADASPERRPRRRVRRVAPPATPDRP
jgi:hypothetical protein